MLAGESGLVFDFGNCLKDALKRIVQQTDCHRIILIRMTRQSLAELQQAFVATDQIITSFRGDYTTWIRCPATPIEIGAAEQDPTDQSA